MNNYIIKKDLELPKESKETFNLLKLKYGVNIKITDLPELLRTVTGLKLEDINYSESWTPQFVSYLIDLQRKFIGGEELDMVVFHQDIIKVFHLSKFERQFLVKNNIEEKLWGIIYAISNPLHEKFQI